MAACIPMWLCDKLSTCQLCHCAFAQRHLGQSPTCPVTDQFFNVTWFHTKLFTRWCLTDFQKPFWIHWVINPQITRNQVMSLGVICRVLLPQIRHVSLLHCWFIVTNRPANNWVQARTSWVQPTARITASVLPLAQEHARLLTHVSSLHPLTCITIGMLWLFHHLVTFIQGLSFHACDDGWVEIQTKRTIRAENEVEANKLVNNYRVRSGNCVCAPVKGSSAWSNVHTLLLKLPTLYGNAHVFFFLESHPLWCLKPSQPASAEDLQIIMLF